MTDSSQPTVSSERITIIDAIRGFALAGIVICHVVENYIGAMPAQSFNDAVHQGVADDIVDGFISILLRGKFIALFSFLFGLSFFIQMDNGAKRGSYFGVRFFWRLLLLLAIGYVHHLFYRGDILTIYAFLGLFLIPFYKINNKWVLLCSALLFLGIGRFIVFGVTGGEGVFTSMPTDANDPEVETYYELLQNGSIWEVFASNATEGHIDKAEFQYGVFGRAYFTFAFFLIGLFVGRNGFFKRFKENKKLTKKVLIYSSIALVVSLGITIGGFASMGQNFNFKSWNAMVGLTGMDLANASMTIIYIVLFVILYRKVNWEKRLGSFAPYGRMALTNYVFQSVIFTFLLFGWGLGLIGELRQLYTFLIAIAFIALQMWISKVWLQYFRYGPLEWLWRSLTFFKVFPFRRKS